jgi:restriction-modification system family protein
MEGSQGMKPHSELRAALAAAGWSIMIHEPLHGSGNPERLRIRRGRVEHRLLAYAWRITSEGTGRTKAGRADLDYRIQTTRSHDGPLQTIAGHTSLGVGWDEERKVFAAFDPWMKRFTGRSSSVHFHRSLLDAGSADAWAEESREDGPEVAFAGEQVNRYLAWSFGPERRPLFRIEPETFHASGDSANLTLDPLRERTGYALRPGDTLAIMRGGRVDDASIWAVESIEQIDRPTQSGNYNRVTLSIGCRRVGVIREPTAIEGLEA